MISIGVDYYPEHWDEKMWKADADLMKKAGVGAVRMGEFAWSRFEPREGEFHFEWLDRAVELFSQRGIDVILCTPTNCPPLWLYEKYPDAVQTGADGKKIATGIRGHRCYNNADLLRYADRIVDIMTKRYANEPSVIAWQIDNELEANFCFCPDCTESYRQWLKNRYGSLDELNRAYGNSVWSGEYSSWEQIKPPLGSYPKAWLNPSYMLDFYRYASSDVIKYIDRQAAIIRKNCPGTLVTTNMWFCENMPDFHDEFARLDIAAFDNYPVTVIPEDKEEIYSHAFHLDLVRGIKRKNFWIMEQLSGGMGCWSPMGRMPSPGMIRGYAMQAVAHGADKVLHFRWRTAVSGAEMHWHGLIDHSNVPGRRFEEFVSLCRQAAEVSHALDGTKVVSRVAVLYSAQNEWAFRIQPQTDGFYYFRQLKLLHDAFVSLGVNVDIIDENSPLDGYEIAAAPTMYITNERAVKNLYDFAAKGKTVILTDRSGVKDNNNKCIMEQLPTVYRELVGGYAEEYDPIGGGRNTVRFSDREEFSCTGWCDIMTAENAQAIAQYCEGYYAGKAAVLLNDYGKGKVYYIGTIGGRDLYRRIAAQALGERGVKFYDDLPRGIEITERSGEKGSVRFIFNNTDKTQSFALDGKRLELAPFEMLCENI